MKTVIEHDTGAPHIWFAALMIASFTLQRMLKEGYKVPEEKMQVIREAAMELADGIRIDIDFKKEPPKGL